MGNGRCMQFQRDSRLRFAQADERTGRILRALWPAVRRKLPGILDRFYNHLTSEPELAKLVGQRAGQLKQAQTGHWERLFAGDFDQKYMESVYRIGLAHKMIGLEPRWYIAGYKFVLNEIVGHICAAYRLMPWRIAPSIRTVNTALMLDVDLAVSTYFCEMTQEILDSVAQVGEGLAAVAGGDLTRRIHADMAGPFAKLKTDFNDALSRLDGAMQTVTASTTEIAASAGEISQAADDLSKRTENQAASLEETAAALEEITTTVRRTAANAGEVSTIVTKAKSAASSGGKIVHTAIQAMSEIEQSSKQITDIIGVIDEIAFQTNLLALNAGVEAARAGDAGKGFAVVASEVRALAQRSSEAAKHIKTLIKSSANQVSTGVKLVGESGEALQRIVEQVVEINALIGDMAQAAKHQSAGIDEVNTAIGQMDQVTQQNAAMVEQSTAASRSLAVETGNLTETISFFKSTAKKTEKAARPATRSPRPARAAGGAAAARAIDPAAEEDRWDEF